MDTITTQYVLYIVGSVLFLTGSIIGLVKHLSS